MQWIKDILFPPRCPGCGTKVVRLGQGGHACLGAIWHPRLLPQSHMGALQGCYAVVDYIGPIRKVIQGLKYENKEVYEAALQDLLERFPWQELVTTSDAVIPIPLAPEKLKKRGFNQTERIFRPWVERRAPWLDCLQRVRSTKVQWRLSHDERQHNMDHAIEVRFGSPIRGKRILLVDDIFTSGSTMAIAAKTLKRNGAKEVLGLALASSR